MASAPVQRMVEQALDELIAAVEAGHSEQLTAYLAMLGRFSRYSASNTLLICLQCPEASQVAGYQAWKRLGRQVRRGAKAIRIFAPVIRRPRDDEERETIVAFKTACVFDVRDTAGPPLPSFARVRGDPGDSLARLRHSIVSQGIHLEYSNRIGGADGISTGGAIVVQPGLPPAEEFSVLAHELAHERLHHGEGRRPDSRQVRETEAEAVAFVVCSAVGLATGTAASDYVQLYQGDRKTLLASLERIQKTAAAIITGISGGQATEASTSKPLPSDEKRLAA